MWMINDCISKPNQAKPNQNKTNQHFASILYQLLHIILLCSEAICTKHTDVKQLVCWWECSGVCSSVQESHPTGLCRENAGSMLASDLSHSWEVGSLGLLFSWPAWATYRFPPSAFLKKILSEKCRGCQNWQACTWTVGGGVGGLQHRSHMTFVSAFLCSWLSSLKTHPMGIFFRDRRTYM